jgi:hypothetical protein
MLEDRECLEEPNDKTDYIGSMYCKNCSPPSPSKAKTLV